MVWIPRCRVGEHGLQRGIEGKHVRQIVGKAGAMREQQAQVDGAVGKGGMAQCPAEPCRHILVQRQQALLDQAHHAYCHDQLGDRGDANGIIRGDQATGGKIGMAGCCRPADAGAIKDDADFGHGAARRRGARGCEEKDGDRAAQKSCHRSSLGEVEALARAALPGVAGPPTNDIAFGQTSFRGRYPVGHATSFCLLPCRRPGGVRWPAG